SGPGSARMPVRLVPGSGAWLTVVKVAVSLLPGVPVPAASRKVPSAALIPEPSTVRVMVDAPGKAPVKNNQANVSSWEGTIEAASFVPELSAAKKSLALRVEGSIGREKTIL